MAINPGISNILNVSNGKQHPLNVLIAGLYSVMVGVGVLVMVGVDVTVLVWVGVTVIVDVGVTVLVGVSVFVGVLVIVGVEVLVGVGVWVGLDVGVGDAGTMLLSKHPFDCDAPKYSALIVFGGRGTVGAAVSV